MTRTPLPGNAVHTGPQPSRTALTAAAARAAHLLVDGAPPIFSDVLAAALLGPDAEELLAYHRIHGDHPVLAGARAQAICRSRYTEDSLARSGAAQYVILGAGLDSYACRAGADGPVRVFEVDHPASQQAKRRRLTAAGITIPETLAFVPVDFETDSPGEALTRGGLDPSRPVFVSWLGVTMYLTRKAIEATLAALSSFAPGTEIVVDHMLPPDLRDEAGNAYADAVMPVAAAQGEPWRTFLSPAAMAGSLREAGFEILDQAGQRDSVDAALWAREDALRPIALSMLTRAGIPA